MNGIQFAVIVVDKEAEEITKVFGPFRSLDRADTIANLCVNTSAVEYFDPDEFRVFVTPMQRYGN